jgi:hypothetical protein
VGRLVKTINKEVFVAYERVHTPVYTLRVSDYPAAGAPPDGWVYFSDDVAKTDFAAIWKQPTGASDAYALDAVVQHTGKLWRSAIAGNVWEPGISSWYDVSTTVPTWVQPTGASDAYVLDSVVNYNGELWASLVDANVWQPGVANWRRSTRIAPDGAVVYPEWVQPTGAGDSYAKDAIVTHAGFTWKSDLAANVWEPGVFGWTKL